MLLVSETIAAAIAQDTLGRFRVGAWSTLKMQPKMFYGIQIQAQNQPSARINVSKVYCSVGVIYKRDRCHPPCGCATPGGKQVTDL